MTSMKHPITGENIANNYHVQLICNRCKKRKNAEECRHMLKDLPPWKSADKHDMVKLLYGTETTKMKNEAMGVIESEGTPLIDQIHIDLFRKQLVYQPNRRYRPKHIFITADPSGTGGNHTAFFATVNVHGQQIVSIIYINYFIA